MKRTRSGTLRHHGLGIFNVQVVDGSHPRYARTSGSGELLAMATTRRVAEHVLYHGPEHLSASVLPGKAASARGFPVVLKKS